MSDIESAAASEPAPRGGVGRASALLASGTMVSRLLGFARSILLAATIGAVTNAADAFAVANTLPTTLYELTAGGVLAAVLVPQIIAAGKSADRGAAYINKITTLSIIVLLAITVVLMAASPLLVLLYASNWTTAQLALATALTFWCMPQVFFYGLYALLGGILNARNVFGPYTWAPALNNVIAIAGLVLFIVLFGADPHGTVAVSEWTPQMIAVLGGTATAGVMGQALVLFSVWRRAGIRFRPDFHVRGAGIGSAARSAGWMLGLVGVSAIVGLVQTNVIAIATAGRAAGDTSIVGNAGLMNAWLFVMLPHSIVTVSIVTVYFTRMAEDVTRRDLPLFRRDFSAAARSVSVLTVFGTVFLFVAGLPVMRIYSAGSFVETRALGLVLMAHSFTLVAYSFYFLVTRAFFALDDTRTPFVIAVFSTVVRVAGILLASLADPHWVVFAIALVVSVGSWFEALLGLALLRRRMGGLDAGRILRTHVRVLIVSLVAGAAGAGVGLALGAYSDGGFGNTTVVGALVAILAIVAAMLIVYYPGLRLLHVSEATDVIDGLRARIRRR